MRAIWLAGTIATLAMAGCGSSEPDEEEPPMKVEDTVVGDLVTTPEKVRDRTDAAAQTHKTALDAQINESEVPKPEE
ncbi:MAG: hypothetical protein ACRER4_08505 [Steroidobacteraceae bacterium]